MLARLDGRAPTFHAFTIPDRFATPTTSTTRTTDQPGPLTSPDH